MDARRERLAKAIRLVWESFESHIDPAVKEENRCESCGSRSFHSKSIREYAFILEVLAENMR
jgi:hypothetical protein